MTSDERHECIAWFRRAATAALRDGRGLMVPHRVIEALLAALDDLERRHEEKGE